MPGRKKQEVKKEFIFDVDAEVKKEFLDNYRESTKNFYASVLEKADKFENEIEKSIYDFNIEENVSFLCILQKLCFFISKVK
jgi:hypothetical protein